MTDLTGKVALVTGGARGIGRAITERLAHLGARVVINYSSSEAPAQEIVATIERQGGGALAVQADVSEPADIERLFAAAIERFGRLDIVVANAGVEVVDRLRQRTAPAAERRRACLRPSRRRTCGDRSASRGWKARQG